jgi:uncharacterized membrane protein YjjP (DUF1212 family)
MATNPASPVPPEVEFCLELGRCLQAFGTPAHRFEATLARICRRFGLEGQFFALPTGFLASISGENFSRAAVERAPNGDMKLEKLTRLQWITDAVLEGRMEVAEASEALRQLVSAPPRYGAASQILAYGAASASAVWFFGGAWREAFLGLGLGLLTGILAVTTQRSRTFGYLFQLLAAGLVAFLSLVAAHWIPALSASVPTLAGIIVLVPGLTFLIAMNELATNNLVAGTARLAGAGMVFLQLAFGVALGQHLAQAWIGAGITPPLAPTSWWGLVPALIVWAGAFLVIFQAMREDAGWIVIACAVGFGAARLGSHYLGGAFGAGLGAWVLGAGSNLLARWRGHPPWVTLLPGIMLLVPGSVGIRSLDYVLHKQMLTGLDTAFQMVFIAVAMLMGLLLANVMVRSRDLL